MIAGEYDVVLHCEYLQKYRLNDKFVLCDSVKILDSDKVILSFLDDGMIIDCDDKEYLKSLYLIYSVFSDIECCFIDLKQRDFFVGDKLFIPSSYYKSLSKGLHRFDLEAKGYDWIFKDIEIK